MSDNDKSHPVVHTHTREPHQRNKQKNKKNRENTIEDSTRSIIRIFLWNWDKGGIMNCIPMKHWFLLSLTILGFCCILFSIGVHGIWTNIMERAGLNMIPTLFLSIWVHPILNGLPASLLPPKNKRREWTMPRCINYKKCKGHVAVWEGKKDGNWVCLSCRNPGMTFPLSEWNYDEMLQMWKTSILSLYPWNAHVFRMQSTC